MRALDQTITILDFESTGAVAGYRDEPWQIGLVRLAHGRIVATERFESLLYVADRPFSRHAPGRHAGLRRQLARAPRLATLWPHLRPWLSGVPLGGHNVATEKRFLTSAFPLHKTGPWIDTLKLARLAHPDLPSHKLGDVLLALNLKKRADALLPGRDAHDALYDALCSAVLLEHLLAQPAWRDATVTALATARPAAFHKRIAQKRSP